MGKFELNYVEDEIIPFVKPLAGPKFRFVTNEGEALKDTAAFRKRFATQATMS